jgi:GNAT superfamily N-acetyltransferase
MDIMETMVEQDISVIGWHPSFAEDTTRLCKLFSDESLNEYGLGVDQKRLDEMTEICKDTALFLLVDGKVVGLIAGMMVNNLTNGKPAMQECVWYVDPEHRSHGKMLMEEFEKMAKDRGALTMVMGLMCNSMQERLDKFYKRLGYKPFEVQYMKELT